MLINSPAMDRLVEAFRRLPGVGRRTAERYAMQLMAAPPAVAGELSEAVARARAAVTECSVCRNLTEQDPCVVCAGDRRDRSVICVVEHPPAALAIEKGGVYRGLYHVLHGVLNPLDNVGPEELKVGALLRRLEDGGVREVILATNTTAEGEATALYLSRQIAAMGVEVSRIAHGVPVGGGVEYADDATLTRALEGRRPV
ncbi:MAG: recombination protein RecR [Candidatus Hydrogenedentes bacterium]|nr:recombination protein RecR [Candidatus Hydrogenedentota bacterium]